MIQKNANNNEKIENNNKKIFYDFNFNINKIIKKFIII